tara:strand:- start:1161 stop:1529 length:369 start_codon:yes stop_codon:yes gene_type:complete
VGDKSASYRLKIRVRNNARHAHLDDLGWIVLFVGPGVTDRILRPTDIGGVSQHAMDLSNREVFATAGLMTLGVEPFDDLLDSQWSVAVLAQIECENGADEVGLDLVDSQDFFDLRAAPFGLN